MMAAGLQAPDSGVASGSGPAPAPLAGQRPLRVLFLKRTSAWPRQSGHDVHCFGMTRALGELGHSVAVATFQPVSAEALAGAVMVPYERAFAAATGRVWVVTESEAKAMRRFGGFRKIDILPNGVDAEYYAPREAPEIPYSCVFWGRLDFTPNVQAVEWFVQRAWPGIRAAHRAARLTVIGFNPAPQVRAMHGREGVEVLPDVPDLRDEACRRAVVVLPFVSGGGIKNKLLEAAAMGRPILCTSRALEGLQNTARLPLAEARSPAEWVRRLDELWSDPTRRRDGGRSAREWVVSSHTWEAVARRAVEILITIRAATRPGTNT